MIKRGFRVLSYVLAFTAFSVVFIQCKKKEVQSTQSNVEIDYKALDETPVSGYTRILVDESVYPIVNEVNEVFMYEYNRVKVDLVKKSEGEVLNMLMNDSIRVAVLPRKLTDLEVEHFKGRVKPKMTHFATDAIVFVTSKVFNDSIVDYQGILNNLKSSSADKANKKILVFDNINSSIVSSFKEKAGVSEFKKDYAYFAGDTESVIDYVSKNSDAIGVIGLNWLTQPTVELEEKVAQLKVLSVKNAKDGKYYKPSQNNIAEGTYPLIRDLYVVDIQGKSGLGVGYASYIAGYKGQRIVLKSNLVPFKVPPRELNVRKEI
ncbi:PstS family phosphate ABC transporter substrate-binding protein [Myroides odoratimimus]|uniref:PstS family phosphate ABC transporter substrate-binding protein n=1 Tax=Myroides odoratimimus TaxID=76832 RepID=UPI00046ADB26|nr:substrate-binding domain-containing protein [Myroides odoratimimus]